MGLYTITINPEDGSGAQTTVSVDVEGDRARIMEVTVRSATGAGLSSREMPNVDFDLLLRAVSASQGAGSVEPAPSAAPARRPAAPPVAPPATASGATRGPAGDGPRRRPSTRGESQVPPGALGGRAYRKMPDDLVDVYSQSQSVTAVAEHYGVPRHTAQGWMNRLRDRIREE